MHLRVALRSLPVRVRACDVCQPTQPAIDRASQPSTEPAHPRVRRRRCMLRARDYSDGGQARARRAPCLCWRARKGGPQDKVALPGWTQQGTRKEPLRAQAGGKRHHRARDEKNRRKLIRRLTSPRLAAPLPALLSSPLLESIARKHTRQPECLGTCMTWRCK